MFGVLVETSFYAFSLILDIIFRMLIFITRVVKKENFGSTFINNFWSNHKVFDRVLKKTPVFLRGPRGAIIEF